MSVRFKTIRQYIPLVIGLLILGISGFFVPWGEVTEFWGQLTPLVIAAIVGLGIIGYLGVAVRYWAIGRMLGEKPVFWRVAVASLLAEPIAVLPVVEFYRGMLMKRYANLPLNKAIPGVFSQAITEIAGLLVIALAGIFILHKYVWLVLGAAAIYFTGIFVLRSSKSAKAHKLISRIPKVTLSKKTLERFLAKNRVLLSGWNFVLLTLASYVTTLAAIGIILVTAHAFGQPIDWLEAAIAYALPLMVVTLLPVGLGINEQISVGILTVFGVSFPAAIAPTLVLRIATLWLGFIYGAIAFGAVRVFHLKEY